MNDPETKALLKAKAKKVKDAVKAKHGNGAFTVQTRNGQVSFESLEIVTDVEGTDYLNVHLLGDTEGGEGHWRIYNPPTAVRNADGTLTENPILAVAEALVRLGGRRKGVRR